MSAHDVYRRELTLLADDGFVRDALGLDPGWARTSGRFHPDADPYVTLTLQKRKSRLRIDVRPPLELEATELPEDVVRAHPGGRTTVRRGDAYGKRTPDGTRLLALQRRLWAARHQLGFAVAEPLGYTDGVLWLRAVPGAPVAFTPALAREAGHALATLHRANLALDPAPDRFAAAAAELIRIVPALGPRVEAILRTPLTPGEPRPIHGAPHPPQWLHDGTRFGLVDFDRLALGDPEADVATFAEAAAAEDDGEPVAEAFIAGAGPINAERLAGYRARRSILKALRAATALDPHGDERAARRLTGSSSTA